MFVKSKDRLSDRCMSPFEEIVEVPILFLYPQFTIVLVVDHPSKKYP